MVDQMTLASNIVTEYKDNPRRNYGKGAIAIFNKWQMTNFANLLEPARQVYDGVGSVANGAAMRIAPIAYFCHNRDVNDVIAMAHESALVTHTNMQAIVGCQLQALAIHQLLRRADGTDGQPLDTTEFLQQLTDNLKLSENENNKKDVQAYCQKLDDAKHLLASDPHDETVVNKLGNNCYAIQSVPTAIYAFLRGFRTIKGIEVCCKSYVYQYKYIIYKNSSICSDYIRQTEYLEIANHFIYTNI